MGGTTKGAFAGSFSATATATACQYFSIINPGMTSGSGGDISGVTAFDAEIKNGEGQVTTTATENYRSFASGTAGAVPYDSTLTAYHKGKFNLKSVDDLYTTASYSSYFVARHYGDWPSPEIFFINT